MPGTFFKPPKKCHFHVLAQILASCPGFSLLKLLLKSAAAVCFHRAAINLFSNVGDFENSKLGLKI